MLLVTASLVLEVRLNENHLKFGLKDLTLRGSDLAGFPASDQMKLMLLIQESLFEICEVDWEAKLQTFQTVLISRIKSMI